MIDHCVKVKAKEKVLIVSGELGLPLGVQCILRC